MPVNSSDDHDYAGFPKEKLEKLIQEKALAEDEKIKVLDELTKRIRDELLHLVDNEPLKTAVVKISNSNTNKPTPIAVKSVQQSYTPSKPTEQAIPPSKPHTQTKRGGCAVVAISVIGVVAFFAHTVISEIEKSKPHIPDLPPSSPRRDISGLFSKLKCVGIKFRYFNNFYLYQDKSPISAGFVNAVGTSAATAGLQQGDIMIVVDDERITSQSTISGRISQHNIGDVISLKVLRPSSYQINVNNTQVTPPYTSMTFNVPIELCAQ